LKKKRPVTRRQEAASFKALCYLSPTPSASPFRYAPLSPSFQDNMNNTFCILILVLLVSSCTQKQTAGESSTLGEEHAKTEILKALKDSTTKPFYDTLIVDRQTAIAMVEPILFKVYGKNQIIEQRPYEAYLIDGYWYISGTLSKGSLGGTFEIIFSANDGRVIRLTHYK